MTDDAYAALIVLQQARPAVAYLAIIVAVALPALSVFLTS